MPDEQSNLKSPAPAGRPSNRRRGRRGGRGRSRAPRPPMDKPPVSGEDIPTAPEMGGPAGEPSEAPETGEAENTGGFREPHAEAPADFAAQEDESAEGPETEAAGEIPAPMP
ncbi:MAG: hypothetical protein JF609_06470 [Verrucomicrobia bacterium]|nr:hypothetical protein [Verrucomicrobiota bacterium]